MAMLSTCKSIDEHFFLKSRFDKKESFVYFFLRVKVSEPLLYLNVTRNYEKFLAVSNKCLQLWCIKHYCDFLTYIGFVVVR